MAHIQGTSPSEGVCISDIGHKSVRQFLEIVELFHHFPPLPGMVHQANVVRNINQLVKLPIHHNLELLGDVSGNGHVAR